MGAPAAGASRATHVGPASYRNPGRPPRTHYSLIVVLSSATRTGLFAFFTSCIYCRVEAVVYVCKHQLSCLHGLPLRQRLDGCGVGILLQSGLFSSLRAASSTAMSTPAPSRRRDSQPAAVSPENNTSTQALSRWAYASSAVWWQVSAASTLSPARSRRTPEDLCETLSCRVSRRSRPRSEMSRA